MDCPSEMKFAFLTNLSFKCIFIFHCNYYLRQKSSHIKLNANDNRF